MKPENERLLLKKYGETLVGKTAQSRILTKISDSGGKIFVEPQLITGYSIQEYLREPVLMVVINGTEVYEDTLFNIK